MIESQDVRSLWKGSAVGKSGEKKNRREEKIGWQSWGVV